MQQKKEFLKRGGSTSLVSKILVYSKAYFILLGFFCRITLDYAWLVPKTAKAAKAVQNQGWFDFYKI